MNTLGKRIAAGRKSLKLTQEQLAEKLGVTAQAVSKWENDQSCPDITMLPRLAELFGTTTDALLGREVAGTSHAELEPSRPSRWNERQKGKLTAAFLVLLLGGLMLCRTILHWDVSLWALLWPSLLLVGGVRGLMGRFRFTWALCALLGVFFLLENTGLTQMDLGGELLVSSVLLVLGMSMLSDVIIKPEGGRGLRRREAKRDFQINGDSFRYCDSFGEGAQFISMERLSRGEVTVSFGDHRLDLTGVDAVAEDCLIKADCSFGELTLLIPRRFRVQCDGNSSFASIETVGAPSEKPEGTILLVADCRFGSIEVRYQA